MNCKWQRFQIQPPTRSPNRATARFARPNQSSTTKEALRSKSSVDFGKSTTPKQSDEVWL
ncbi:unnamed protein product [Malus baccata var. baccata]